MDSISVIIITYIIIIIKKVYSRCSIILKDTMLDHMFFLDGDSQMNILSSLNSLVTRFSESTTWVIQNRIMEAPVVVSIGVFQDQRFGYRH